MRRRALSRSCPSKLQKRQGGNTPAPARPILCMSRLQVSRTNSHTFLSLNTLSRIAEMTGRRRRENPGRRVPPHVECRSKRAHTHNHRPYGVLRLPFPNPRYFQTGLGGVLPSSSHTGPSTAAAALALFRILEPCLASNVRRDTRGGKKIRRLPA